MDKAISKFNGMSKHYSKYRPSYPDNSIIYIFENAKISVRTIADIWAWTWKLTKLFLDKWWEVYAIEPNKEMLNQCCSELENYKNFHPILATAEETTLPNNSIDLIVVWQAFHRFDLDQFKKESKRILKENGSVALLYNNWDKTSEIIKEIDQLSKKYCPCYKGSSWWLANQESNFQRYFSSYEKVVFSNDYILTLDTFLGLNFSASYAPKSWEKNYEVYYKELIKLYKKYANWALLIMPNNTILRIGKI